METISEENEDHHPRGLTLTKDGGNLLRIEHPNLWRILGQHHKNGRQPYRE
jgi:hypothetical protein